MMQTTIYLLLAAAIQGCYGEDYHKDVEMAFNTYKAYVGICARSSAILPILTCHSFCLSVFRSKPL